jgi:hypothetical protein
MKRLRWTSLAFACLLATSLACGPLDTLRDLAGGAFRTWYVSPDGLDDNDCRSWETACLTLPAAVALADGGDTIRVGEGAVRTFEAVIDKQVAIIGSGVDTTVLEWAYPYVLSIESDVVLQDLSLAWGEGLVTNAFTCISVTGGASLDAARIRMDGCGTGMDVASGGEATLDEVTITNQENVALFNDGGSVTLRRSRIVDNDGIGIVNNGTMVIEGTTVDRARRSAGSGDSLPYAVTNTGEIDISGSTISRSPVVGIINSREGTLRAVNTTISSNDTGLVTSGTAVLQFVTVADNARGLSVTDGHTILVNSLIAGNDDDCWRWPGAPAPDLREQNYSTNCRWIPEGGSELGPLADNGGPTLTHALLEGNVAIDSATGIASIGSLVCPPTDQRGALRPSGRQCDVGAFEYDSAFALSAATAAPTGKFASFVTSTPGSVEVLGKPKAASVCRVGPGDDYELVRYLRPEDVVKLIARDFDGTWVEIEREGSPDCWTPGDKIEPQPPDFDPKVLPLGTWAALPTETPGAGGGQTGCLRPQGNKLVCSLPACDPQTEAGLKPCKL